MQSNKFGHNNRESSLANQLVSKLPSKFGGQTFGVKFQSKSCVLSIFLRLARAKISVL